MKKSIQFFDQHLKKILKELKQKQIPLSLENISEILRATSFKTRSIEHKEECPCYDTQQYCHKNIKEGSCFLCGCPNYNIDLNSRPVTSCKLNKNYKPGKGEGGFYMPFPKSPDKQIWNCDGCNFPHHKEAVENYLKNNIELLKKLSKE
jgi:hypothetical protein